jgi:C-terminal processing protease CtpA/Prc
MSFDFFTRNHRDLNKPLTEFRENDLRHATITKTSAEMDTGLKIEKKDKKYYIKEVTPGGLFHQFHSSKIQAGDRLVKINNQEVEEQFTSVWDINEYLKNTLKIKIHVERTHGLHLEQKNEWGTADYASNPANKKTLINKVG